MIFLIFSLIISLNFFLFFLDRMCIFTVHLESIDHLKSLSPISILIKEYQLRVRLQKSKTKDLLPKKTKNISDKFMLWVDVMANNNKNLILGSLNVHLSHLEMLSNKLFKKNPLQLMLKLLRVVYQDNINHNLFIYAIVIQVQKMLVLLITTNKTWILAFGVTNQLPNTIEEDIHSTILFKLRNAQLEFGFEGIWWYLSEPKNAMNFSSLSFSASLTAYY